jgi:hypothetical protein
LRARYGVSIEVRLPAIGCVHHVGWIELIRHLLPDLEAARAQTRPNGREEQLGPGLKGLRHAPHRALHDALREAAPPGVDQADAGCVRVVQEHRRAVGHKGRERHATRPRDQRIGFGYRVPGIERAAACVAFHHPMDVAPMDLLRTDPAGKGHAERLSDALPVAQHPAGFIPHVEGPIECVKGRWADAARAQ